MSDTKPPDDLLLRVYEWCRTLKKDDLFYLICFSLAAFVQPRALFAVASFMFIAMRFRIWWLWRKNNGAASEITETLR